MNTLRHLTAVAFVACIAFNSTANAEGSNITIDFDIEDFYRLQACGGGPEGQTCHYEPVTKNGITAYLSHQSKYDGYENLFQESIVFHDSTGSQILSLHKTRHTFGDHPYYGFWFSGLSSPYIEYIDRDKSWLNIYGRQMSLGELTEFTSGNARDWLVESLNNPDMVDSIGNENLISHFLQYTEPSYSEWNWLHYGIVGGHIVISAIPEPETYAMLLVGLGLVAQMARRRQNR